jgi:hypothetical protein
MSGALVGALLLLATALYLYGHAITARRRAERHAARRRHPTSGHVRIIRRPYDQDEDNQR